MEGCDRPAVLENGWLSARRCLAEAVGLGVGGVVAALAFLEAADPKRYSDGSASLAVAASGGSCLRSVLGMGTQPGWGSVRRLPRVGERERLACRNGLPGPAVPLSRRSTAALQAGFVRGRGDGRRPRPAPGIHGWSPSAPVVCPSRPGSRQRPALGVVGHGAVHQRRREGGCVDEVC